MNFDFSEEQKLLQKTARDYLADQAPLSLARAVMESDTKYSDEVFLEKTRRAYEVLFQ